MMPILQRVPPGGDDAGTVGPDEPHGLALEVPAHPDHVEDGDALGDADDELAAGVDRLDDGVGRARGRHEDARGVGAGVLHGLFDGVEDGDLVVEALPAAAGRDAGDDVGAVLDAGAGVERAGLAGDALEDDPGVLVDEDAHRLKLPRAMAATIFCAPSPMEAAAWMASPLSWRIFLPCSTLVPFEPHDEGHPEPELLGGGDDAGGDDVAAHDAAEDVDEDALHLGALEDDLERRLDLLLGGAAAHVEEVGRRCRRSAG